MDLKLYIQLIFLCVVNIIFTFSGIVLNTLVIASFWKSSQLRKKLCHFMIMVLSCFDLLTVIANNPGLLLFLAYLLRDDYDSLLTLAVYLDSVLVFYGFSFLALLVLTIERYLGSYYPIFHRTSVTRRRLLTLLAVLSTFMITLYAISTNDMMKSRPLAVVIFMIAVFLPLLYLNFKLLKISREVRRRKTTSPEKRTTINLKTISSCLLVVACVVVLSISAIVCIAFITNIENEEVTNTALSFVWAETIYILNCTLNSLIFFWKNKVLRAEGMKIVKTLKDGVVGS